MKKLMMILQVSAMLSGFKCAAQSYQVQHLILDIEKLAELKGALSDLYQEYSVLFNGYETIKGLAKGNFNLHDAYLSSLLQVNPVIAADPRVQAIIQNQAGIISQAQSAIQSYQQSAPFTPAEFNYLSTVYQNIVTESGKNTDELSELLTPGTYRMSDQERLEAIEQIYARSLDQLIFLRQFNNSTNMLVIQRIRETNDNQTLNNFYKN